MGALNGADAIAFTAGVGENCPSIRERILQNLDAMGVELDIPANAAPDTGERLVSKQGSKVKLLVIPTNEELMIARQSINVLTNN